MKPALEHLPKQKNESFVVKYFDYHFYPTPWHYHPELEIVLVTESTGKRFIGNHVADFKPGNLAFLGANIPHTYKNEDRYYMEGSKLRAKSIVIHFSKESLGDDFLQLPEAAVIGKFFQQEAYGFDISGKLNTQVSMKLQDIVSLAGFRRWACLAEILFEIATAKKDIKQLSQQQYVGYNQKESDRLRNVLNWVMANLETNITLTGAAEVAQMNANAFSRFFSLRTRKTFSAFIKELRLQKAASLLIESEVPITQICYECGYNNISNFNRQFLDYYSLNPMRYKKVHAKKDVLV
ncbi:MAG: AraC family transcriptional regulator [Ferruginibacter sp.]